MKNQTTKRFLALLLALCMCFTLVLMTSCGGSDEQNNNANSDDTGSGVDASIGRDEFISDIGGVSDTYEGTVSEESYNTADEAARAYISEEVIGTQKSASIESTTSKGTLSADAIGELNLPAELSEGIESVEKIEVKYSEVEDVALVASSSATKSVIVFVIKYANEYKYFTPMPIKGDTITKSYYESVFQNDKYENCTYVNESTVALTASAAGQSQTLSMKLTQTIKRDGNKTYLVQSVTGDENIISQALPVGTDRYLEVYMEEQEDGSIKTWLRKSALDSWTQGYVYYQVSPFAGQNNIDYSYFSKTDFGFALKGENALKYYRQAATNASAIPENAKLDLYAEYYVNGGVLSGMRMEYSAEINMYGTLNITNGLNKMSCTNYGTTVVEKPF